tara:strand:+ start:107 stop:406 length:300 start_codon:yes stop_codon:yes gene_type:complete
MSRYENAKVTRNRGGQPYQKAKRKHLYYGTTIYSDVPEKDDDIYITTQDGDRLDNLAMVFYGSPTFWWFIAHTNNLSTINVEAGLTLRIPATTEKAVGK